MKPKPHEHQHTLPEPNSGVGLPKHPVHKALRKRIDLVLFLLVIISSLSISIVVYNAQVIAKAFESANHPPSLSTEESALYTIRRENIRKLESFFAKHESPLYPYARIIVEQAEQYGIDYRLVPAIAMNESTLCKNIHENSYNCWGWGIYGDNVTRFESYEDAIRTITKGIRKHYYDKGMSSPSAIMKVYTPGSPNGVWAEKIEWAFRQIDKQ